MNSDPCKVCGNTDMNLIDGFYYCVECGTQDANLMETMIEDMVLKDGTFAAKQKTRITNVFRVVEKVSPEWHKWQAYNYILCGMVKEVMDLGAGPKFKMRVMWLWTLYVKKFQRKKELGLPGEDVEPMKSTLGINRVLNVKHRKYDLLQLNICKVTVNLLVTIIYLALNFDRSEILISDLCRFIREGRLTFKNSAKFLPKEIDVTLIEGFQMFNAPESPNVEYNNTQAMTVLKTLELGSPIVPDLRKIVVRYVKELCLPREFSNLVLSLMDYVPCDYLDLDKFIMKQITSIPFYEGKVMAYILVALKMCFGLDDEYEIRLSDAVDHINNENCHMKCHKLGMFSTTSDRLFSFRDWIKFLQLRKLILSRCYVPLALLYHTDFDDYVYMEQRDVKIPYKKQPSLSDDIIMSLLERIRTDARKEVIPKNAFPSTLTPFTDYTDVVLQHYHDPEVKLLLSEDFTQYSLEYACVNLDLRISDDSNNIIVGVEESSKCIKKDIKSKISAAHEIRRDYSLVYIRNCENKHWLKTNPPTKDHIKKVKKEDTDEKDHDVVSLENSESDISSIVNETIIREDVDDKKLEFIDEDRSDNIFDDDFKDFEEYEPKIHSELLSIKEEPIDEINTETGENGDMLNSNAENLDFNSLVHSSIPDEDGLEYFFNPETFDRESAIKHLVLLTCKKYSIPIPKEYKTVENKAPRKRKCENVNKENTEDVAVSEKKPKTRTKPGEARNQVNVLLSAYYDSLKHDVFSSVSHHVKDLVDNLERIRENFNIEDQINEDLDNNVEQYHSETLHDSNNGINIDETQNFEDPSIVEIQNQTKDESAVEESETAYRGDPKFDDKIYDVKQLYVEMEDESLEDIFDIRDDPEVDRIISKKIDELASTSVDCKSNAKADKREENYNDWDDDIPLSEIKEQILEKRRIREDAFNNLEYLITNRRELTKNNYWIRKEKIMSRVQNRSDSFTNDMKECFPRSFSFLLIECAAMLDCTPFILYKYMCQIEEYLI